MKSNIYSIDKLPDVDSVYDLNHRLNQIRWGIYRNGKEYWKKRTTECNFKLYRTKNPQEIITDNGGTCWDYVGFQALYLKEFFPDLKVKSFYVEFDRGDSHTFTLIQYKNTNTNKYIYFESSYKRITGVYKPDTLENIIGFVLQAMIKDAEYKYSTVKIYEYDASDPRLYQKLNVNQFIKYIYKYGKKLDINPNLEAKLNLDSNNQITIESAIRGNIFEDVYDKANKQIYFIIGLNIEEV